MLLHSPTDEGHAPAGAQEAADAQQGASLLGAATGRLAAGCPRAQNLARACQVPGAIYRRVQAGNVLIARSDVISVMSELFLGL